MSNVLALVALGVGVAHGHSVKICQKTVGNDATFYAGTYHSIVEDAGSPGLILGGNTYPFTGTVDDDGEFPLGVSGVTCSQCPTYTSNGIRYWFTVTVSGLTHGTYSVSTTCQDAVECPWCTTYPDLLIGTPEPTPNPTNEPTVAPTWVTPCVNNPCQCDDSEPGFEDPHCEICHAPGCNKCQNGPNGEYNYYFKLDYNFPCVSCDSVFDGCDHCQDFNGCAECDAGYQRTYDSLEDLYYCQELPPTTSQPTGSPVDPPATTCTDGIGQCTAANCYGENPNCADEQTWGCPACQDGYFQKSHQYPCKKCNTLVGCVECDHLYFNGCLTCASNYQWYWDVECNIGRCQ